ncbi:hypothetical protein DL96DRAFT_1716961 [Flagelloscypha sp. PMI_526]|nr:hypothetical protein DL96DRAFT_1716961 [Flagelloscypha sp. PMI_526]
MFQSGFPSSLLHRLSPHLPSSQTLTSPTTASSLILVNLQATSPILANYQIDTLMLPLQYSLLGGGNALSYPWEPGFASIFRERRPSCSLHTAGQRGANSSESSLSCFSIGSDVSSPLGPPRTIPPSPRSDIGYSITRSQIGRLDILVFANEPVPRASTSSASELSSDSSPSLPHRLYSKRPGRDIGGLEPVPPSVNPSL